jgi:hypothetical protein
VLCIEGDGTTLSEIRIVLLSSAQSNSKPRLAWIAVICTTAQKGEGEKRATSSD